jgi:DNA topoisomerase-3
VKPLLFYFKGGTNLKGLIISEKPSVGRSIAAVLGAAQKRDGYIEGDNYLISWCAGHLLELAAPDDYGEQYAKWRYEDLPIVPETWKHTPSKEKAAQLKILKELMKRSDVDCIINACDAGREGELIFRLVYEYANCKTPIKRLWVNSMEDAAIKDAFAKLRDGTEYDNLYHAALCREQADWTVGISATRLFSILYGGTTLNVGRVQSPTLAMLVKREADIAAFVKTPFFTPIIDCGFAASGEKLNDREAADAIRTACDGNNAEVISVDSQQKSVAPPKLYDLTSLQREANRAHGFTAQQTLDYMQSLYEKKLATYPRTDSRFLTDDMAASVTELVKAISFDAPCDVSQVINAKKVSDHHAVIPTVEAVKTALDKLPDGERAILKMLINRLVCAVGEKHRYLETAVTLVCNGAEFKAKGKSITYTGWKDYAAVTPDEDDEDSAALPELSKGQIFDSVTATVKEGFTSPAKHYTEDTILSAMETAGAEDMPDDAERKGLGTSATRAGIIEKLIKTGFVERQKKNLIPTDKGKNLIAVLPTALTSAKLTAEWENKLLEVQRGNLSGKEFMNNIAAFTKAIVLDNNKPKPEFVPLFPNEKKTAAASLGACPRCGSPVREGIKGFFCDSRACEFKLWKTNKFFESKKKPLSSEIVTALLKDGRAALKGLYSEKTGKTYDATVILDDTGGKFVGFKMDFAKGGAK